MKSFKELSRIQKILVVSAGLLAIAIFFFDEEESSVIENEMYPAQEMNFTDSNQISPAPAAHAQRASSTPAGKVVVYDKGLQMPISTMTIPEDWKVIQDIAFDPNTGRPAKYKFDITGPEGELVRSYADMFMYGATNGKNFEQVYQEALRLVLQGELEQPSLGNLNRSQEAESNKKFQRLAQKFRNQGQQINAYEVEVSGQRNGRPYKGKIVLNNFTQQTAYGDLGILQPASLLLSPSNLYNESLAIVKEMSEKTVENPAHEQRMDQINQQVSQRMAAANAQRSANAAAAHRQRMANNQAAFDAHQQRMGTMSQMQDASHQNYMNSLRNSGSYSSSSNSGYSSHDAYIDQIHERSTFNDPSTGYDKQLDGQYDYNYTNGLGEYYRTNDPSFDHNSLQGDWQETQPLSPNY